MVQLKADPWRPDFGMGSEISFEEEMAHAVVDPAVETADWSRPVDPDPCRPDTVLFVDGVMRTELRVMARDGDRRAWGLIGSCAAGAVRCDGAATFVAEDEPIERAMFVGSRIGSCPPLAVRVAGQELTYGSHPVADDSPTGLRRRLQRLMLDCEQDLAARLATSALVFADGPLHLDRSGPAPVVGVVKRMVAAYLAGDEERLLTDLRPKQRTPVFALGNKAVDRYAWYLRLIEPDRSWHDLAGLVRCEVRMELGLESAIALADRTACCLPEFAGRPGVDPRAPQNLTPVGALEARLKHRLGHAALIRHALQAHLANGAADV